MTIAHAYTLLIEAGILAASFAALWLSFWIRDRQRLGFAGIWSQIAFPLKVAAGGVKSASEKHRAILPQ